jgi:hypothetical protein
MNTTGDMALETLMDLRLPKPVALDQHIFYTMIKGSDNTNPFLSI